jgi:hypothetical protein
LLPSELQAVFNSFDKDKDGHISSQELEEVMKQLGLNSSSKEVQEMIAAVDVNGKCIVLLDESLGSIKQPPSFSRNKGGSRIFCREGSIQARIQKFGLGVGQCVCRRLAAMRAAAGGLGVFPTKTFK